LAAVSGRALMAGCSAAGKRSEEKNTRKKATSG
jgi:hypothetical protein